MKDEKNDKNSLEELLNGVITPQNNGIMYLVLPVSMDYSKITRQNTRQLPYEGIAYMVIPLKYDNQLFNYKNPSDKEESKSNKRNIYNNNDIYAGLRTGNYSKKQIPLNYHLGEVSYS